MQDQYWFKGADGETLLEHPIVATDVDSDDARYEVKQIHEADLSDELVSKAIERTHDGMGRPEQFTDGYVVGTVVTTLDGEFKGSTRATHHDQPDNPDWEVEA